MNDDEMVMAARAYAKRRAIAVLRALSQHGQGNG